MSTFIWFTEQHAPFQEKNFIEGYARFKPKVHKNFLETAYGSLQESRYLLEFSLKEEFLSRADFEVANRLAERIGAMLFGILKRI